MSLGSESAFFFGAAGADGGGAEVLQISRSVRFNSDDSAYLDRTPSIEGNRRTWTWSGWVKRSVLGSEQNIFGTNSPTGLYFQFETSDKFRLLDYTGSLQNYQLRTTQVFRDPGAWLHIVFALDTTLAAADARIKLYINGEQITDFDDRSNPSQNYEGVVNSATSHTLGRLDNQYYLDAYLAEVNFIDGEALGPTSFGLFDTNGVWQPKEYTGTYGTNGFHLPFSDNSTADALGTDFSGNGNDWTVNNILTSTTKYSDYLFVTGTSTLLTTKNGTTRSEAFDGSTTTFAISDTIDFTFEPPAPIGQSGDSFEIQIGGAGTNTGSYYINGTLIQTTGNGNPMTTTLTAPITSVRITRQATQQSLSYIKVNGAFLIDADSKDNDSLIDVPTNGTQADTGVGGEVRGNYSTLNPLSKQANCTLSNGNLDWQGPSSGGGSLAFSSFGMSSGKWYCEYIPTNGTTNLVGLQNSGIATQVYLGENANSWSYYQVNGNKYNDGTDTAYGSSYDIGDAIGIAFDADNGILTFYKNGVSQGDAFSGLSTSDTYFFAVGNAANCSGDFNFGQRPFAYTAPEGFKALCTANLPAPVITKPSEYMDVVTYTGIGTTQTISGLDFSPDLVWVKNRTAAWSNILSDVVRGSSQALFSDLLDSEQTRADGIVAFNSDGFNVGPNDGVSTRITNAASDAYVAWTWDAGSSTVTNTDGSITSQVRANPSAGFSIVSYTGSGGNATVGHGLNVPPSMLIVKRRDLQNNWRVGHDGLTDWSYRINLESDDAESSQPDIWNSTAPTNSVFSIGTSNSVNANTGTYIAYCWAPLEGYSAFGTYTGNSDSDGPFVYTGFRPKFILIKGSSFISNWFIQDDKRDGYNVNDGVALRPNLPNGEDGITTRNLDILSNGFKIRSSSGDSNSSGATFIWSAFAENPFSIARAR